MVCAELISRIIITADSEGGRGNVIDDSSDLMLSHSVSEGSEVMLYVQLIIAGGVFLQAQPKTLSQELQTTWSFLSAGRSRACYSVGSGHLQYKFQGYSVLLHGLWTIGSTRLAKKAVRKH